MFITSSTLQCYSIFDRDHNGYLDAAELKEVMKNIGENMADEEVQIYFST